MQQISSMGMYMKGTPPPAKGMLQEKSPVQKSEHRQKEKQQAPN